MDRNSSHLKIKQLKKGSKPINNELYCKVLITQKVSLSIVNIGNNLIEALTNKIASQIEGKCIVEGYIKQGSVEVLTFSSGIIKSNYVVFDVVFECYTCFPVDGMFITCVAKNINKAGIKAELNESPSPVIIFIARDHNYSNDMFSNVKENDTIQVRVIGHRFELYDSYISIIAELTDVNTNTNDTTVKTMVIDYPELENINDEQDNESIVLKPTLKIKEKPVIKGKIKVKPSKIKLTL